MPSITMPSMTPPAEDAPPTGADQPALSYLTGFHNELSSEAVRGAVPVGRNSPQRHPLGLYAELQSGTAFTVPRHRNRRTWTYRIRPSAAHRPYHRIPDGTWHSAPFVDAEPSPNRLRWDPVDLPTRPCDFVDGIWTYGGNGQVASHLGVGIHAYRANESMTDRYLVDADGELLVVPQAGRLRLHTELGILDAGPGEIALIPRGMRWRVELLDAVAAGYLCENYGASFELPELGPIGSNGLADPRDFRAPVAAFEDSESPVQVVQRFGGHLWATELDQSPLDVVGWHGTLAPYIYDTAHFMVLNTVSFDHADPSIFTVLTSPTDTPGLANADFVIFPPRWQVAEDTFRPPWYHRNVMSEFMGLVRGTYDAKAGGFAPGGASLHNSWNSHGADAETFETASNVELLPAKLDDTLAFMFETRLPIATTRQAMESRARQEDYDAVWAGLPRQFRRPGG